MARKSDIEEKDIEMTEEEDSKEPRVYELAFHLDPELSESEATRIYGALKAAVTDGGTLVAEGEPEKVQLAYTISRSENAGRRDFDSAYFAWVVYEADGAGHDAVAAAARAEKAVVRFLDIRTTKELAEFSRDMRELRMKAPEPAKEDEPVSDAELDAALTEATA